MRIQSGQLVALGYGKYVRSDEVIAVDPITDERGPGRRTYVWVRGIAEPLIASRGDGSIVDDLVTPIDEAARMKALRSTLGRVVRVLEGVSPGVRRVVGEEAGVDLAEVISESRSVLG